MSTTIMNKPTNRPERGPGSTTVRQGKRTLSFFGHSYAFLASVKLALALLIAILVCCIIGVTIYRGTRAGEMIFGTLWFNGMLVLLVVNVAFSFFGRIWGRKVTLISLGMILFHLSFVAMLIGIIYNSLFFFRGSIRLTEGETLPSGVLESYDYAEYGTFFDIEKLKGETSLIKMHTGYQAEGADRRAAYEISVGEGATKKQDVIYITKSMDHNGVQYYNDKEGFSVAIVLSDKQGKELYGALVPLQSFQRKNAGADAGYFYMTGSKDGPGSFPFPQEKLQPLFLLQVNYVPSPLKQLNGEAMLQVWPLASESLQPEKRIASGTVPIGGKLRAGDHYLEAREVRYWVGMTVRYEPGKPIVLGSLWVCLGGMVITFIGRMRRDRKAAVSE
jgi:hypothetical protein